MKTGASSSSEDSSPSSLTLESLSSSSGLGLRGSDAVAPGGLSSSAASIFESVHRFLSLGLSLSRNRGERETEGLTHPGRKEQGSIPFLTQVKNNPNKNQLWGPQLVVDSND